jgi:hypothetical protein
VVVRMFVTVPVETSICFSGFLQVRRQSRTVIRNKRNIFLVFISIIIIQLLNKTMLNKYKNNYP